MEENIKDESLKSSSDKEIEIKNSNVDKDSTDTNGSQESMLDKDNDIKSDSEDSDKNDVNDNKESDPLTEAIAQIESWKDKYLRSVAEFDNYRKRTLKEKTELILNGSERAVIAVLPVIDDMERAIENANKTDDIDTVKEGMKLIYQKLSKALESLGVKKIETEGADFNTDYHEAIAMMAGVEDEKKGKVLDCVQAGYTLNEKVIRHAKVAVGQ